MSYQLVRLGPKALVISNPHERAYGHLAEDILATLHIAKQARAWVYLFIPADPINRAIYDLRSPDVRVMPRDGIVGAVITTVVTFLARRAGMGRLRYKPLPRKAQMLGWPAKRVPDPRPVMHPGLLLRREIATRPIPVHLPPHLEQDAQHLAGALGIRHDTPMVTLHVRESGYKYADTPGDRARNAAIETYVPAIDSLVRRGFTVVRVGDKSMTPISRPGVVDLANSPTRTDWLEIWCLLRSKFLIAADSGLYWVAWLTNTPCLGVNITNPTSLYPLRRTDMYILKHVVDRASAEVLPLERLLSLDYLLNVRNTERFEYIDNSAEEIEWAVSEMIELQQHAAPLSSAQCRFRDRLTELLNTAEFQERWGDANKIPERDFLGEGRIGRHFVERCLDTPAPIQRFERPSA